MRVDGDWLIHPGTQAVMAMLREAGHQAFFVGGCVRNAALGVAVSDIDIASDATPDEVILLAEAAGFKAVATGFEHGTITIIARGIAHEVTTFRRDVETDGRRAVVAFSTDMAEDAARRDFTMNALYADATGQVFDPTGNGIADLQARRVRFIGAAEDRIREDYLRILRFFRFHAIYGAPGFEAETLAALASLAEGIGTISKERIGQEMRKLLAAPDPAPDLATMAQIGLLMRLLTGAKPENVAPLVAVEARLSQAPNWLRRLAALNAADTEGALRLSKRETKELAALTAGLESTIGAGELGYRHGNDLAMSILALREALLGHAVLPEHIASVTRGAEAQFPLRAADLPPTLEGPAIGEHLRRLEARWIDSGFTLSRDELLA